MLKTVFNRHPVSGGKEIEDEASGGKIDQYIKQNSCMSQNNYITNTC